MNFFAKLLHYGNDCDIMALSIMCARIMHAYIYAYVRPCKAGADGAETMAATLELLLDGVKI